MTTERTFPIRQVAAFAVENDVMQASLFEGTVAAVKDGGLRFRYHALTTPKSFTLDKAMSEKSLRRPIEQFLAQQAGGRVDAIGVSTYGAVDIEDAIIFANPGDASDAALLKNIRVRDALSGLMSEKCIHVENDATAAAMGEYIWGVGKGQHFEPHTAFAYIWVSRGVNAGYIVDGKPMAGRFRPETGHMKVHRFVDGSFVDPYPGSCKVHHDCITGMAGRSGVYKRREMKGVNEAGANLAVADYIAQLCAAVSMTIAPVQMAFGGQQMIGVEGDKLLDSVQQRMSLWSKGFPIAAANSSSRPLMVKGQLKGSASLFGIAEITARRSFVECKMRLSEEY